MSVSIDTTAKIARLARLAPDAARQEELSRELTAILSWIEQLNEVATDDVEPLASVTGHALPMRVDEVTDGGIPEKVLANAPQSTGGFFVVPKVVE